MNISVFFLWRVRVLAVALAVVGAGALSLMMVTTASAAAPNGFTSQTYKDNDGNGTVDTVDIVINGGEVLDACIVTDAEVLTDWAYVGNDIGGSLATSGSLHGCDTATATVSLYIQSATAGVTGHATAPTIAYDNDDADNSISNATGDLGTVTAQSIADGAAPQIKSFTYQDNDGDGKTDRFLLAFTETVIAATSVLHASHLSLTNVGDFTGAVFGAATSDVTLGDAISVPVVLGTEATANDTAEGSGTIAISTVTGDGTMALKDAAGNSNSAVKAQSQATFIDGAAPQIKSFTYLDTDVDGRIDTFRVTWSETVTAASTLKANQFVFGNDGDFDGNAFYTGDGSGQNTDLITSSVTTTDITMATEAAVQDTANDNGSIHIATTTAINNEFSITDGTNTNTDEKVESQTTFVDGAGPVLITATPSTGSAGNSRSTDVVLTFSEPINTSTDAIAFSPTVVHSEVWSAGNTVLTLDGTWNVGTTTVTFTTANDVNGVAFAGAEADDATVASPFIFSVTGGSSASFVAVPATYDIDVTSPNGGEELNSGDVHTITWDSTVTGSAMAFANINLSYTSNGSTVQETIVTGTTNNGSYAWTIPNIDTDSATIQVVGTDLAEALATDESDAVFTIGAPSTSGSEDEEEVTAPSSGTTGISPVTGEVEDISMVAYGDYIRSAYFDTVYFVDMDDSGDLIRRPFLDAQTFMTWVNSWSGVQTVTDATLPTLALGGPMLPKAGVVLVKIQSDARVFAIQSDNTIRWITTEAIAIDMYGADWADYVIDIQATLFPRFDIGDDIDRAEDTDTSDMKTRLEVNS